MKDDEKDKLDIFLGILSIIVWRIDPSSDFFRSAPDIMLPSLTTKIDGLASALRQDSLSWARSDFPFQMLFIC